MAHCQKQFFDFHDAIRLKNENEELRKKRDIIIKEIKENMPDEAKSFTTFNQGSYAMNTGIKPLDDDYDIDLGIYFDMSKDDGIAPVEAKQWVYEAVKDHTDDVRIKTPCVTVTYKAGYHVDITVYAAKNDDNKVYLAKGKPGSSADNKKWDESNPKDLITTIRDHLEDEDDRKQFRRIVRYLKRWKDEQFNGTVYGKPTGIALTSCVYRYLDIKKEVVHEFSGRTEYRDLEALIHLVSTLISQFIDVLEWENDQFVLYPRLKVALPVSPYPDLFEKMTNKQMKTFKEKLETLLGCLEEAHAEIDPTDAAEILQKQFGSSFPIPPRPDTGKKSVARAVIPSNESA